MLCRAEYIDLVAGLRIRFRINFELLDLDPDPGVKTALTVNVKDFLYIFVKMLFLA